MNNKQCFYLYTLDLHLEMVEDLLSDLHGFLSQSESEQVDDGVLALRSHAGVLVLGVVQQTLQERLDEIGLHGGGFWFFEHPPQHPLRHQSDVAGLILKTLRGSTDDRLLQQVLVTVFIFLYILCCCHVFLFTAT